MNRISHYLLPIVATAGGWWAGRSAPVTMPAASGEIPASQQAIKSDASNSPSLKSMLSQISALRSRPGHAHEIEWVKWCLKIPDADVPHVISQLDSRRDQHALRILYSRWAKLDFPTAWASFLKAPIPVQDLHFYLSERASSSGLSHSSLQERPKDLIAMRMLTSLKTVDPERAKGVIVSLALDSEAMAQSGLVGYNLSQLKKEKDEDAVVDYAAKLKAATGNQASQYFTTWLGEDPASAMNWFRELPPEKQAGFDYRQLSWKFGAMTGSDTMAFLMASQGKGMQDNSEIQIAAEGTSSSYEQAREYGRGSAQIEASNAIRKWAVADPKAALAYVQQLPANDFQSMLLGQLAGQLAANDSAQAIALINQHPGDQTLGMKGMVSGWAEQQPKECWEWLNKISDPETLQTCLGSALKQWSQTEPELAVQALSKMTDQAKLKKSLDTLVQGLHWNPAELQRLQALAPQLLWKAAARGGGG
jgi:hypothetical protein